MKETNFVGKKKEGWPKKGWDGMHKLPAQFLPSQGITHHFKYLFRRWICK